MNAVKGHRNQSDLKMSGAYAEKISLSSAISASENEADEGDGPNKGGSMGYQQVWSLTQNVGFTSTILVTSEISPNSVFVPG